MKSLKKFIEVSWNNIQFSTKSKLEDEILKNIWVVTLIDECNAISSRLGRTYPTFLNGQKEVEYHGLAVSVARTYKVSL